MLKSNLGSPNQVEEVLCLSQSVSSIAQLCPALCNTMDCSTLGLPVHHQLLELVMDTEARHPAGHGVPKSQTRLSN